jgi:hypothetical protein
VTGVPEVVERRRHPRVACSHDGQGMRVRLRGAGEARIVNLSVGGALVETTVRLLTGRTYAVQWHGPPPTRAHTAEVVRCELVGLEGGAHPLFRAAVVLKEVSTDRRVATTHAGTGYSS